LAAILWENDDSKRVRLGELLEAVDHPTLERAEDQLSEYFAGTQRSFDKAQICTT
jgi:methylated-DNA-[protein]-cysteine S-methyltransferase